MIGATVLLPEERGSWAAAPVGERCAACGAPAVLVFLAGVRGPLEGCCEEHSYGRVLLAGTPGEDEAGVYFAFQPPAEGLLALVGVEEFSA